MTARLLTTSTTLVAILSSVLPAKAADPQLLNLVMPDAKVIAGVNVDQAKTSPFGQYVLSQMQLQDPKFQALVTLTGFDPTRDVHELLVASTNVGKEDHSGLALARGTFDVARIIAAATLQKEVTTETYAGVTILEDAKATSGIAFLNNTLAIAGDLANVKAAIDRQKSAAPLPAAVLVQVNHWSSTEDAWGISTVAPSSLAPFPGGPAIPGMGPGVGGKNNALQNIQSAAGGIKFGANVVATAQAVADTAENAKTMGDTLKLLVSIAQMQAASHPEIQTLAQNLTVTTSGSTLSVSISLPADQFQQLLKPKANVRKALRN